MGSVTRRQNSQFCPWLGLFTLVDLDEDAVRSLIGFAVDQKLIHAGLSRWYSSRVKEQFVVNPKFPCVLGAQRNCTGPDASDSKVVNISQDFLDLSILQIDVEHAKWIEVENSVHSTLPFFPWVLDSKSTFRSGTHVVKAFTGSVGKGTDGLPMVRNPYLGKSIFIPFSSKAVLAVVIDRHPKFVQSHRKRTVVNFLFWFRLSLKLSHCFPLDWVRGHPERSQSFSPFRSVHRQSSKAARRDFRHYLGQ